LKLSSLIKDCQLVPWANCKTTITNDPDILSISSNSKEIKPGTLFIAIKGFIADGHDYIDQALDKGAVAVIAEDNKKISNNSDKIIVVENSRLAMASIADSFYGHPSRDMILVGITGTNGKTTTTWILESIFNAGGFSTGVIGTVNIRYNGKEYDNPITTPDSIDLQKTLFEMKKAQVSHVIMEVSSHGLDLNRIDFCDFNIGVFTNLSQDHLDYHKDMDEYFDCKKRLFTQLLKSSKKQDTMAVLNIDDIKGKSLFNSLAYNAVGVSTKKKTDIFSQNIQDNIHGLSGTISLPNSTFKFKSSLIGKFNLENILCAAGAAHALNISKKQIERGIENCHSIPGRLEKINTSPDLSNSSNLSLGLSGSSTDLIGERFLFVDYAHTPDALDSILCTLKKIAPKKIITIFGCGGDRDRSKRPLMGEIACKHSDIAIVSSDNPRTENPDSIIDDILKGLDHFDELTNHDLKSNSFKQGYVIEVDRKKAIQKAVAISKPEDIIIVAGKGHETYQITNNGSIHFDDKEELADAYLQFAEKFKPMAWALDDLITALGCEPALSTVRKNCKFSGISTDSRSITPDQIFLALKGDTFDGHAFIKDLIDRGIKGFVAQNGFIDTMNKKIKNDKSTKKQFSKNNLTIFETQNTLTALGKLAQYQRERANVRVVAITGSCGKTTTRKITQGIFSTQFHTLATKGNLNNEIGMPLTLLNLSSSHEWAIVEMGMNHAGEISRLTEIAKPDIAIITNTAGVHLEGLGTVDNVAKAKAEIFEGMNQNGIAIIPRSDPRRAILETKAKENKNIKHYHFFGPNHKNGHKTDHKPEHISDQKNSISGFNIKTGMDSTQFSIMINNKENRFSISSPALFMVDNCLAATSAAMAAKISIKGIQKGIQTFNHESGRMNIYKLNGSINIIDDTYNANPSSVIAALETLKRISKNKNSIAVLGDMLELGKESDKLHWNIGQKAASLNINRLFIFGPQGKYILKGAEENHFPPENIYYGTKNKIAQKIMNNINNDTWILVKGSRGMAMETIIDKLKHES
jgi:MurE/MurF fusion protein